MYSSLPSTGVAAGWLDVPEQRGRHGVIALLPGQTCPEHGVDLVEPRYEDWGRRVDHDLRNRGLIDF